MYQIPRLDHNIVIRSFLDAPAHEQPFANVTNLNKNRKDLAKFLRDDAFDGSDLDISDSDISLEDDMQDNDVSLSLDNNLESIMQTLGRLQDDIGSVLNKKGKGKAKDVKPIPSRLSTPESFPSQSQIIECVIYRNPLCQCSNLLR